MLIKPLFDSHYFSLFFFFNQPHVLIVKHFAHKPNIFSDFLTIRSPKIHYYETQFVEIMGIKWAKLD